MERGRADRSHELQILIVLDWTSAYHGLRESSIHLSAACGSFTDVCKKFIRIWPWHECSNFHGLNVAETRYSVEDSHTDHGDAH